VPENDKAGEPVRLRLARSEWTLTEFDPQVEGVPALSHDMADVPADKEQEVRTICRVYGVSVTTREEG
jgi:hypothetical protein